MERYIDQASTVRKGDEIDAPPLAEFLKERLPDFTGDISIQQFQEGFSNLTYLVQAGEMEMVLRRPPRGQKAKSAHNMEREFLLLKALEDSYPLAPRPIVFCENEAILGCPFYLMERVKGLILRKNPPPDFTFQKEEVRKVAENFIENLYQLHQLDYEEIGLADFGKPRGYNQRQVEGWIRRYAKAQTDEIESISIVADWLENNCPPESDASLIHNDYKYDNLVLDPQEPTRILALLDWELAALGDPLMDLGTALAYWIDRDDPEDMKKLRLLPTTLPGSPTRSELVVMYEEARGREIPNILFYYVFSLFKIAVIGQQIYYRYQEGKASDERFASLIEYVKGFSRAALQAMEKGRI